MRSVLSHPRTRRFWVTLHRWAGLYMSTFLIIAGLTGAIMAYLSPLDQWLNPALTVPRSLTPPLDPFDLRERALALQPEGILNVVQFNRRAEEPFEAYFEPKTHGSTNHAPELEFNRLVLNPFNGAEIYREKVPEGLWPITRRNVLGLIVSLHYSLALPGSIGVWLFGIASIIWTFDCFVGFALTLPRTTKAVALTSKRTSWWSRWAPAWTIRLHGSLYRIQFFVHRALGLWIWPMLLVFACSGVAFNLSDQVYNPVMQTLFGMDQSTLANLQKLPAPQPEPIIGWRSAYTLAQKLSDAEGLRLGFKRQADQVLVYDPDKGQFYFAFRSNRDVFQKGGGTVLAFDGKNGLLTAVELPTGRNTARTFTTWILALHTAGVGGSVYRAFVSALGLLIAVLSASGVYIWWKKRSLPGTKLALD